MAIKKFDCRCCANQISFLPYINKEGDKKVKPVNLDGTDHLKTCDRLYLFGRSKVQCKGCGSNLERDAGRWETTTDGMYFNFESQVWVRGRWFPAKTFRVISCPACGWFYNWNTERDGFDFLAVESILSNLDFSGWIKLKHGELKIVVGQN